MTREQRLLFEALGYFAYGAMVLCIVAWGPIAHWHGCNESPGIMVERVIMVAMSFIVYIQYRFTFNIGTVNDGVAPYSSGCSILHPI